MKKNTSSSHVFHPPITKRETQRRFVERTIEFFRLEAAGGILLVMAAFLALILANTPWYGVYDYFFNSVDFRIGFSDEKGGDFEIKKSLLHWVNDGFMAIFFLLAGLEIKREIVMGNLSTPAKAVLPIVAAIGGVLVPAGIFWLFNKENPEDLRGWAIPCATDIAFALGVLSLLGRHVPLSLKVLLTAIAIIDDLVAILIIALFYTGTIDQNALLFCLLPLGAMLWMNRRGVGHPSAYVVLGVILWMGILKSGVHGTIAGVITAFFIPAYVGSDQRSPAARFEHDLHPWVVFLILPIFAFANAGVPFAGLGSHVLTDQITLGIVVSLFLGKQLGVFGGMLLCLKMGWSPKPYGTTWIQLYGLSLLCGIGFTMSLFIGGLSYTGIETQAEVRLGVLCGSILSAIAGYLVLRYASCAAVQSPKDQTI